MMYIMNNCLKPRQKYTYTHSDMNELKEQCTFDEGTYIAKIVKGIHV